MGLDNVTDVIYIPVNSISKRLVSTWNIKVSLMSLPKTDPKQGILFNTGWTQYGHIISLHSLA